MKSIFHILFFAWALGALASPSSIEDRSVPPDNIVYVTDAKTHWFVIFSLALLLSSQYCLDCQHDHATYSSYQHR